MRGDVRDRGRSICRRADRRLFQAFVQDVEKTLRARRVNVFRITLRIPH
jgi:hypothetical protein